MQELKIVEAIRFFNNTKRRIKRQNKKWRKLINCNTININKNL